MSLKSFLKSVTGTLGSIGGGILNGVTGGLAGVAANGISSLFGQSNSQQQDKFNKQQMLFQADQAQLQRDFNASEAEKAYQRQLQMFNMTNKYNSPVEYMERLRNAGLNENFAYGFGNMAEMASSPMASSGASPAGFGSAPRPLDDAMQQAQIGMMEAQTRKINSETNLVDKSVNWYDQLQQSTIDYNSAQSASALGNVKLINSQVTVNEAEAKRIGSVIENLSEQTSLLIKEGTLADIKVQEARIDLYFRSARNSAELKQIRAQTAWTEAQTKQVVTMLPYLIMQSMSETELNKMSTRVQNEYRYFVHNQAATEKAREALTLLEAEGVSIQNGGLVVDMQNKETFGKYLGFLEALDSTVETVYGAVNVTKAIRPAKPKRKLRQVTYDRNGMIESTWEK